MHSFSNDIHSQMSPCIARQVTFILKCPPVYSQAGYIHSQRDYNVRSKSSKCRHPRYHLGSLCPVCCRKCRPQCQDTRSTEHVPRDGDNRSCDTWNQITNALPRCFATTAVVDVAGKIGMHFCNKLQNHR